MNKTPNQVKREKKEYIRGTLSNMDFWGKLLFYLWIVRLRAEPYKDFNVFPYNYILRVQIVNPWNPLAWFFGLGILIGFLISKNINITKSDFKDLGYIFKFE